ncbi:MAG TPA: hypothetical protein VN673_04165 [Clostridia bacterium]|nr:hypothetical protein [Clostridia bacterium]
MQLRYDEDLVEDAVFTCAARRRDLPALQIARFHRAREKLYRILDPEQRNHAFFQLHLEWFREWGLEQRLLTLVREFPLLPQTLSLLGIRKARAAKEEAAELYVQDSGAATGILALRPERFLPDSRLEVFLRHELTHLHDMLDPAFGYSRQIGAAGVNPAQQRLAFERYRLLWDITIDARLADRGLTPAVGRPQHAAAFAGAYSFLPEEKRDELFDRLWQPQPPRHAWLAELACDPRGLRAVSQAVPGAACPLCSFPTFDWVLPGQVSPALTSRIQREFPAWTPDHGLCGRCLHIYQVVLRASKSSGS